MLKTRVAITTPLQFAATRVDLEGIMLQVKQVGRERKINTV